MNDYNSSATKRTLDIVVSAVALLLLAPVFCAIAIAVFADSGFPVLFRQQRVGRGGRLFEILKFRSMRITDEGSKITVAGDSRITRVGHFLRDSKLDELPQFWNVLRGDMSLTGPRPEDPAFVDATDPTWAVVLSAKPGMTDVASLVYLNEELLLTPSASVDSHYRTAVLPDKLALGAEFVRCSSLSLDFRLLLLTAAALFRARPGGDTLRRMLLDH